MQSQIPVAVGSKTKEQRPSSSRLEAVRPKRILIVDAEDRSRADLRELLESWDYVTEVTNDGRSALDKIHAFSPHVILTDLRPPRMDAFSLLQKVDLNELSVVVIAAQASVESAVEAMKLGAYDYLTKPIDIVRLRNILDHLEEKISTTEEIGKLRRKLRNLGSFGRLHGTTPLMQELFHQIELAAPSAAAVLISGESGTGKELVARTIHDLSPRKKEEFVAINCSAIPATLLESELFGHEKGSFTGAVETRPGCFELADHGTLFLDEIATMAPDLQAKLLRVLENGRFRRVGGRVELQVDVRIIAASNVPFDEAIRDRVFREDLYYRLNVFELTIPPLRDRIGDISLLSQHFVETLAQRNQRVIHGIHPEAMRLLKIYAWPGNVRELKNMIERAVIVARTHTIMPHDFPQVLQQASKTTHSVHLYLGLTLADVEKEFIEKTLGLLEGNRTKAAKMLAISLKTLHNKLTHYKIR